MLTTKAVKQAAQHGHLQQQHTQSDLCLPPCTSICGDVVIETFVGGAPYNDCGGPYID